MVEVYALNIDEELSRFGYRSLLAAVSKEKRERIQRFHFIDDAKRTLYADVLVRFLVSRRYSVPNRSICFRYNAYGKPELEKHPEFCFNVSHSGSWVVCAAGRREIGIDIEQIQTADISVAKRFFTENEFENLLRRRNRDRDDLFYKIWTLKESYIKNQGRGLSIPLNSFGFFLSEHGILLHPKQEPPVYFDTVKFEEDYRISVCSREPVCLSEIQKVTISNLAETVCCQPVAADEV